MYEEFNDEDNSHAYDEMEYRMEPSSGRGPYGHHAFARGHYGHHTFDRQMMRPRSRTRPEYPS